MNSVVANVINLEHHSRGYLTLDPQVPGRIARNLKLGIDGVFLRQSQRLRKRRGGAHGRQEGSIFRNRGGAGNSTATIGIWIGENRQTGGGVIVRKVGRG